MSLRWNRGGFVLLMTVCFKEIPEKTAKNLLRLEIICNFGAKSI